jgi:phage-related protein
MIVFDGISLDSVAKVDIDDVYVSPIQYDFITRPRAIRAGSDFVRNRAGTRTITITFALLDDNMVNRQKSIMAITQWAKNDKEYKLELPGHPEHYLVATCTERPSPSLRQWWEGSLRLVFTCFDNPYWNSKYEKQLSRLSESPFVFGDAPPLMRLERTNSEGGVSRSFTFEGKTISFNTSLPMGKLIIDINKQIATVDGVNVMQYCNPISDFFDIHPGYQNITSAGYYYYRERWQ